MCKSPAGNAQASNVGRLVEQGLLEPLPDRGKRNMAYTKPSQAGEQPSLLSGLEENNDDGT
jgi:hypothetical protein